MIAPIRFFVKQVHPILFFVSLGAIALSIVHLSLKLILAVHVGWFVLVPIMYILISFMIEER